MDWDLTEPAGIKLTFLRDIVRAAHDPQAEGFPLLELASSIIRSPVTPAELMGLVERYGLEPDQPGHSV